MTQEASNFKEKNFRMYSARLSFPSDYDMILKKDHIVIG